MTAGAQITGQSRRFFAVITGFRLPRPGAPLHAACSPKLPDKYLRRSGPVTSACAEKRAVLLYRSSSSNGEDSHYSS